jgi:hypothetical protein
MPDKKNEKIKLYMVLGLLCVAGVVAYFQFFRSKDEPAAVVSNVPQSKLSDPIDSAESISRRLQTKSVPAVQPVRAAKRPTQEKAVRYPINQNQKAGRQDQTASEHEVQYISTNPIRDIFERPYIHVKPEPPAPAGVTAAKGVAPKEIPLELKGTIISGDRPIAIINNQFLQLGDTIDVYRVSSITSNEVLLKAGSHKKIIQVMKMGPYLDQ